jgi:hypothetical protein
LLIAAETLEDFLPDGRVKLKNFMLAQLVAKAENSPPTTMRADYAIITYDRPVSSLGDWLRIAHRIKSIELSGGMNVTWKD